MCLDADSRGWPALGQLSAGLAAVPVQGATSALLCTDPIAALSPSFRLLFKQQPMLLRSPVAHQL